MNVFIFLDWVAQTSIQFKSQLNLKCKLIICAFQEMFVDGTFKYCPKFFFQLYNVLKEMYPDAQLKCCRFHLAEAWWRKIQSVGLSNEYKNAESQLGKWLKWFFELHFDDAVKEEDIFVDLMPVAPDEEKCIKFADYLVEN